MCVHIYDPSARPQTAVVIISMDEESWRRNHGGGIMEEESWRRNNGGGIMEEE
jgi:hypothetical protein